MSESEHTCDLCFEDFDRDNHEPRKLPCCHTYCSQCLEKMVSRNASITCPNDRSIHKLGILGVFGLPLDSSKLADIDKREVTSPVGSINFSSDFVEPSRPTTARPYRQAQNHVNNNLVPVTAQYNTPQPTGNNYYMQPYPNMLYNYNTEFQGFSQIPIYGQHITSSVWQSPYQCHFNNTSQFYQPMMTTATSFTHDGNCGQNIISYQPIAVNSYQPMAMNNYQQIAVNNMNTAWWSYHFNPYCQPQMCSPVMAYPVQLGPYATAGQFQMMAPYHPMVPVFQQQTNFQNGFPVVPQPTCNTPAAYSFGDNRTVQHNIKGDSIMNNSSIVNHGTINIHPRV